MISVMFAWWAQNMECFDCICTTWAHHKPLMTTLLSLSLQTKFRTITICNKPVFHLFQIFTHISIFKSTN